MDGLLTLVFEKREIPSNDHLFLFEMKCVKQILHELIPVEFLRNCLAQMSNFKSFLVNYTIKFFP